MYGPLIIAYLFLGGTAAGALFVISVWSLQVHLSSVRTPQTERQVTAFSALRRRTYAISFMLLALAMTCLLWDLGTPRRAPLIFLHSRPTVLTFGAYTLAIESVLAAFLAVTCFLKRPALQGRALTIAELLCCSGAVATMSYTAVFLMSGGIAFWNTWALVDCSHSLRFRRVSLRCCSSTGSPRGKRILLQAAKPLQGGTWPAGGRTIFLSLFVYAALSNPAAESARAYC